MPGAPRGAERPRRALKTGPSTRSIASVSRLLGYQETPSSHDQNAAAPSVAGAGRGQPPLRGHRARDVSSPLGPWATAQDLSEAASRVSHWLVCLSWASCPVAGLACRRAAPWSCPLSPVGPAGGQPRLHRQALPRHSPVALSASSLQERIYFFCINSLLTSVPESGFVPGGFTARGWHVVPLKSRSHRAPHLPGSLPPPNLQGTPVE